MDKELRIDIVVRKGNEIVKLVDCYNSETGYVLVDINKGWIELSYDPKGNIPTYIGIGEFRTAMVAMGFKEVE